MLTIQNVGVVNCGISNAHRNMGKGEISPHLEMTKFTVTLTRDQRTDVSSILHRVDKFCDKKVSNPTIF